MPDLAVVDAVLTSAAAMAADDDVALGLSWGGLIGGGLWVTDLALKIAAVGVLPRNRKPSAAMAWLILIMVIPFAGFALFLMLGRTHLSRGRLRRQRAMDEALRRSAARVRSAPPSEPPYLSSMTALAAELGSLPPLAGNRLDLVEDYAGQIAAMTEAIGAAEQSVDVEFYIMGWDAVTDPFFAALVAARERGVRVRLMYDHLGTRRIPGFRRFRARLRTTGIEVHEMLPLHPFSGRWNRPDLRNHRKILVVDGRVGFVGSLNLIEPEYGKPANHRSGRRWKELVARVEGPVVTELHAVFASDWFVETGEDIGEEVAAGATGVGAPGDLTCQVLPSGPGYGFENNLRLFTALISSAQRRVSLTSPYFVPDEPLLYAVTTAAQRGLDVELFVCEEGDQFMVHHAQCSYYRGLLEAGVRIFLYPKPAVLHSKHFSIDDDVAVIGSSNMDMRSFALNYEVSMMVTGGDVVARFRAVEDHYRSISRELTLEEWEQRGPVATYVDNAMRLTAALQ